MKIGIYGGSFNPCHLMHKEIVFTLLEKKYFDRIIILPTGNFYKKSNLLKGEERIKMLELMFSSHPKVIISDYEFKNNLICTYRSLDYFQNLYKGDQLFFIIGSDNLLNFHLWKRYEYILDQYNLLVIQRKDVDVTEPLKSYQNYKGTIELVDLNLTGIQSSDIRKHIYEGEYELAKSSLDLPVYDYIMAKGFYSKHYNERKNTAYISDEEFMKQYSNDDYEKMSVTTDITLFSVSDIEKNEYRKNNQKSFSILLVKRNTPPFMDKWCLPGGFLSLDEKLLDCAKRVLYTETNLDHIYLDQIHTFSDIDRDIRGRVLSVAYLGLVDKTLILSALKENSSFYDISFKEEHDLVELEFKNEETAFKCKVKRMKDVYGIVSYEEEENHFLAFDNLKVIMRAIDYLKDNLEQKDFVFHMLPERFTLKELQLVYETILDKKLIDSVFRRSIQKLVVKTQEVKNDGGHRPSRLYKYKKFI
ncbi:MAG: nicotinate (nicotinamide) nucleotide adenylyltransferase [Anaeroplasmataceae bacterium]|nr:nicotinate (nicotinamide) nucleotide adenylyltransferase [Anaeroplasmataceae bacterium]